MGVVLGVLTVFVCCGVRGLVSIERSSRFSHEGGLDLAISVWVGLKVVYRL